MDLVSGLQNPRTMDTLYVETGNQTFELESEGDGFMYMVWLDVRPPWIRLRKPGDDPLCIQRVRGAEEGIDVMESLNAEPFWLDLECNTNVFGNQEITCIGESILLPRKSKVWLFFL